MKVGQAGTLNLTGASDDVEKDRDGTSEGGGRLSSSGQESYSSVRWRRKISLFASSEEAVLDCSSSDHCDDGTIRWDCGVVR
jgi:hypothetical protein